MPARDEPETIIGGPEASELSFQVLDQASFDPIQYLNDVLPTLNLASHNSSSKQSRATLLQDASSETQEILSRLSTHNIRSSSELTTFTDEILRSGNRLAYEVEVLRGDTNNLHELLTETLKEDISQFVTNETSLNNQTGRTLVVDNEHETQKALDNSGPTPKDPEFIRQLRTLGLIKARLEAVINVFGEALKWPVAPSEVSMASLISVSAPELGVVNSAEDDKAREYTRQLRNEITMLLDSDGGGYVGLEAAAKRANDFRELATVWKGTVEEKARVRVVEGLSKLVEDRRRGLESRSTQSRLNLEGSINRSGSIPGRAGRLVEGSSNTAAGLFRNLQKLRDEIYLE